jgi:hypothetical protein
METIQEMDMAIINEADTMDPARRKFLKVAGAGVVAAVTAPILSVRSSSCAAEKRTGNVLIAPASNSASQPDSPKSWRRHDRFELHPHPEEYM